MKHIRITEKNSILKIIFWCSFFAFGLFHEYIACIYSGFCGLYLCFVWKKNKCLRFYWNIETVTITAIVFMYLMSCLYGVDWGTGIIGFIKMLSVFFFLCCMTQISEVERVQLLDCIPLIGSVMTVIGITAYIIEPLRNFFFVAQRLGGTFQYPNVFALFCLLGLIRIFSYEKKRKKTNVFGIIQAILLIAGIFLSGSRTVFFLLLLVCMIWIIKEKRYRIPLLLAVVGILGIGIIYTYITGDFQNVGRFLTTSASSSTLLGRVLYIKDGIHLMGEHPMGLGYLGYYFMEPGIQTGVYSIRFIHNDFLQMALDIGVIPCILFIIILIKNICNKQNSFENRISILVMGLHCMMDFDLEFTSMWFLMVLFLKWNYGKKREVERGKNAIFYKLGICVISFACIYVGAAMLPAQFGNTDLSVQILPFYTEAKVEILKKENDMATAVKYANEILSQNEFVPSAYDVLAVAEYQKENYPAMVEYKEQSLRMQKYNIEAYERYILLLAKAIENTQISGDEEMEIEMRRKVITAEIMLHRVEESTDELAYEIRDIPDFELDSEILEYISQTRRILKK